MPNTVSVRGFAGAGILGLTACLSGGRHQEPAPAPAPAPEASARTTSIYTCPDDATGRSLKDERSETDTARKVAPKAEGATSQRLYELGQLAQAAYVMYDAHTEGRDLMAEAKAVGYPVQALIYGDPGRYTEYKSEARAERRADEPTFYGFVASHPETHERFVVFRGTLEAAEWVRNIQIRQEDFPQGGKVHIGFNAIYASLRVGADGPRGGLFEHLASPDPAASKTTFVGHSLGGALAAIAAIDATDEPWGKAGAAVELATFAAPRPGDPAFAALAEPIASKSRVCNVVDIVPAVPFSIDDLSYAHVGELFAVSSFDFDDQLNNATETAGEQILCWHDMGAYRFMLDPQHAVLQDHACFPSPAED